MKSLKKIKAFSSLARKNSSGSNNENSSSENIPQIRADTTGDAQGDGPEGIAARNVRLFCESSGGPDSDNEILFLPPIVDAAESSPEAAAECARIIRQYLRKQYKNKPSCQYNAIMLIRILSDNPGPSFTRNIDQKFTDTCKTLLTTDDRRVNQMMMDTLDAFENTKSYDENLHLIIGMWQQEKHKALRKVVGSHHYNFRGPPPQTQTRPADPHSQNYFARQHAPRRTLPDPVELAGRLEEARTSAKVLHDIVANTPPQEVLSNDLIKEFADRCLSASRSIQGYMSATDPAPDHDTMESLIDTNEQLQASMSLHQRAMLNARKQAGESMPEQPSPVTQSDRNGSISRNYEPVSDDDDMMRPPPGPPPNKANGKGKQTDYLASGSGSGAGPSRSHTPRAEEDPFKDPEPEAAGSGAGSKPGKGKGRYDSDEEPDQQRHFNEPFHPGFGSTPSYVNRQESAVGKEAMHGAVPATGASASGAARRGSTDSYDSAKDARPTHREMYRY